MRKLYWYLTTYAKKHGAILITSVVIAIAVFSFIVPSLISVIENKKTQYVGLIGDFNIDTLPIEVTGKLSAGLTKINPDGTVEPLLAQRWSTEQEGKTYRFILKEGIFFRDGRELTTQDITYYFPNVETIVTPNDIVFKLPDSFAPFPVAVSQPILRKENQTHKVLLTRPTLIGIGPYSLTDYEKIGNRISEVRLEGRDDKYIYRFYLTEKDAVTAFKHGEVDLLPGLSQAFDIVDWKSAKVTKETDFSKYLAVFFNMREQKFTKNIRQALSYAIDKPTDESRALGPISPESWAYLPALKTYDKDIERGIERILDEPPQEKLEFNLTTTSTYQPIAEEIIKQWEEFGQKAFESCQASSTIKEKSVCENMKIKTSLKITNFPDTSNFELLLIGQESPPDPDQYQLWHSGESTNFTGYKNTRIDNLLEKGRQTTNFQERKEIYQEFQQFFLEDAPAIFIKHLDSYTISR
ncbi:MAG: peptide ABC transporter substrate-binding protein [Patescibacteria group bacterium]|nr:MAG: peptide ABC transporter substrate-binding protein [Patescibacteria group bacterium]